MADDPWAEAGAQPGGAGGYLSDADFRAAMDATYGKGRWHETGGYRTQAREAALRAAGAQTVPAGHTSPHSLGEADAPGAHDITVDGLTPAQAAAAVRARSPDLFTPLPEDAHGGQGAHLHLTTAAGTAGGDPWGEGTADPWSEARPAHRSFLEEAGRLGSSLIGGAVTGAGKLLKAGGEFGDVYAQAQANAAAHGAELSPTGQPILTPEASKPEFGKIATEHQPVVSSITDPWAEATEAAGESIAPTNRQGAESVLHGAGEMVAPVAAMTVDPALGGVVFGVQGYGQAHDEAAAKGAPEGEAQTAGLANFGVQAGLGMVPVGELTAPLSASLKGLARVGARLSANVVGDAALGAAMQTGSNLVAQQTYDPDRPWYDQVPQSAAMMAAGGLVVHGTHEALGGAKALLRRPEAPPTAAPDAETMPETNAIRAYAGKGPVELEAPATPEEGAGARPVPGEGAVRNPAASPIATGDYVLFDAGRNPAHGQVIGDAWIANDAGEPIRTLLVKTPAGNAVVPASQAVALPGDFEAARITHGAPLEQMPQAIADIAELRRAAPKGYSVLQAIRDLGGIRTKGADGSPTEVGDMLSGQRLQPGVVNNKTGMSPDAMREALQQRGWFGETAADANRPAGEAPGDRLQDLLDIVDKGTRQRVVHPSEVDGDARRKDLEEQMNSAGVGIMTEPLPEAAAKLAAWRGEHVKAQGADMALLRKRAEDLGVRSRPDASYDELLADVVEREAIQGEATAADADEYEGMIDAELTPEEHEWLTAGPRGAESEPGPSFEPEGAPGRDEEPPAAEGGGQPGADAGGGGEDQGAAGEEPDSLEAAKRAYDEAMAAYEALGQDATDEAYRAAGAKMFTAKAAWQRLKGDEAAARRTEANAERGARNREVLADEAAKAFDFVITFPPELDRSGRSKATELEDVKAIHDETSRAVVQDLLDAEHYDQMDAQGLDPATGKPPTEKRREGMRKEREEIAEAINDALNTYEDHFGAAARRRFEAVIRDRAYDVSLANREPGTEIEPRQGRARKRRGLNRSEREDREIAHHRGLSTRRAAELMTPPPESEPPNPLETAIHEAEAAVKAAPRGAARTAAERKLSQARGTFAAWQRRHANAEPTVERQDIGGETVEQQLLAGGERSARQAAKAREGALKAKAPQRDAGELFGAPEPEAGDLFGKDPWADKGEAAPEPPKDIALTPEAKEARAEAEAPKGSGYGEKNKLFNKEAADAARAKLAELNRRSSSGIDPEMIHAGITLAGYHVEAGARKFGDYAAAMLSDLGEWAAPYLRMWYNALRDYPEFDAEGMTPHDKITDAAVEEARANVRDRSADLEPDREGTAPADADGAQPLSAGSGEAERGLGGEGTGAAAAGLRPEGGQRLPDGSAPPVGEGGAGELFQGPSGAGGRAEGGGEPGGGDVARDAGVQPDRIPATDLERVADEAAHLDPVSAEAHPDAEAPNAPPVPRDIEEALPTLFPEQRADVAFAEQRFAAPDGHGVMFTNGTGTGKTFTGGGIIKRFADKGRKDVLVLAPTQGILNAWRDALKQLGVDLHVLESTADAGRGVTGTTYANLAANRALATRKWDLVVPDEAHSLSSDMEGSETQALAHFRAITNHPDRLRLKAEMLMPKDVDRVKALRDAIPKGAVSGPTWEKWLEAQHALDDKLRAKVVDLAKEPRAKAAFLSATPFAYDKSVDYAQGYLFDYGPKPQGGGYNTPASAADDFMIRHFGYRMRTGKLTKPEAGVESDVMERQFHEWLRRKGALSGRVLTVDKDYDRKFALIDGGVGRKIDDALTFLREADDGKFRDLARAVEKQFDYLSRARLLEAIKAKGVIPRIRAHLALGRKVVVFHNYNEGGGFNPFDGIENVSIVKDGRPVSVAPLVAEFHDRNPGIRELGQEIAALGSPLEQLTKAFPEALIYNGTVPKARRAQAMQAFNRDGSGHNLIIVQSEAGQAGISLHDTTGTHQRAIENLGLPGRPVAAIQQEGRIYRIGQASDAIFRYLNTGTNWERHAFATTIAQRAGTAENLALGEQARTMRDSFINAFLDSGDFPPARGEGRGGKAADRDLAKALTDFQKAKSFYFSEGKNTGRRDNREGKDYFATPEPVGLKMVEWADVRPGDKVLEPSAGHGAIARFFPETADRTLVEPSSSLASRAALSSPGANVLEHRFEDLHAVNKFDAIVMNPPFGHAGATAIEHIKKAANHLRDGGRIVALIPRGAADEKLAKFMESPEAKGLYQVADINLPTSTFERAGTKVNTRIVVLEKQLTDAGRDALRQTTHRDYSGAGSIAELFDRIEHSTLPERVKTEVAAPAIPEGEKTYQEVMADRAAARARSEQPAEAPRRFIPAETTHGKTGEPLYVATAAERMDGDEYKAVLALAKQHGGYYSYFRGKGAIPGFQFKTAEDRAAFLAEASNDSAPKFQVERRDTPPDLFAGIEPLTPRAEKGPFAEPAPDPGREHFDQNHADLYRLAQRVGTPEQRKAEAQRLATEMGQFMDWSEDEDARLAPDGTPRPVDMMRAAREYADTFKDAGKASFYDAEAYHDVMQRWYERQGGERPKFQREGGGAPIFYSAVERLIDTAPMRAAPPEQWRATLKNAPGIKQEEINWLGVNDWLDLFPAGEKIPKEAVQAFVRDHGVKVEEKVLGDERSRTHDAEFSDGDAEGTGRGWYPVDRHGRRLSDTAYDSRFEASRVANDFEPTAFSDWTLPGGKNYRELLLTLPQIERPPATHWDTDGVMAHVRFNEREAPDGKKILFVEEIQSDWHQKGRDQGYAVGPTEAERSQAQWLLQKHKDNVTEARRRVVTEADRLFAEVHGADTWVHKGWSAEHASDHGVRAAEAWLQNLGSEGRVLGEGADELREALQDFRISSLQVREAQQRLATLSTGIADAPFKSSWPALVMKRVIRWAVDNGYDRVAWTTGEQQADRYDLAKHVSALRLRDNSSGGIGEASVDGPFEHGTVHVYGPEGTEVMQRHVEGEAGLRDLVGADLAQQLLAAEPKRARYGGFGVRERYVGDLNTHIGGEGMKAFYDRNLVNITNDLIKKHSGKVETKKIEHPEINKRRQAAEFAAADLRGAEGRMDRVNPNWRDAPRERDNLLAEPGILKNRQMRHEAAQAALREAEAGSAQHGFDITPKLAEAVAGGQPLFQRPGQGHVGFAGKGAHLVADLYGVPADAKGPQADAIRAFAAAVEKVAPHVRVKAFERLTDAGYAGADKSVVGATYRRGPLHVIAWSLETPDAMHTAHHEAIHALRNAGLFTAEEWRTLESAAVDQDWMGKYGIADRWGQLPWDQEIEEAIAERFANWQKGDGLDLSTPIGAAFQKIKQVLASLGQAVRRLFGQGVTAEDVLRRVSAGEVGQRAPGSGEKPGPVKFQRKGVESADEEPKGPAKFITRVLGKGVDTVGKKLARAAERVLPDPILSLADETKMALSPMGSGSARAQAAAKDFANELRASAYQWDKVDKWLGSRFSLEQQKKMWEAADEEGVLIRRGVTPGPDAGMNRLTADERAAVTELQRRADTAFAQARELGMVNSEGLESYVPRMVVQMTAGGPRILARAAPRQAAKGGNLSTTTGQLRQRKYETVEDTEEAARRAFGDKATVVRNIRTLALGTQRLERAIAGRVLVDKIKAMSKDAGADLVVEGGRPDAHDYFTLDHPALQRWGPKFITVDGKVVAAKDQNGDVTFQATPVWISREFEGPLKAVLSQPTSGIVRALGDLKGKMMSVIMYSPLMHNAVIWGKAIPADPRGVLSLEAYRRGFAAKQDRATMEEAMRAGLDPIGRRFFNQDVTSIAEGQQIVPGRSWTSQVMAYVPGLFDPKAGEAVKVAVDKLGDLWHNTFLWDRVADLQMGLYVHIRDQLTRQGNTTGIGAKDAQRIAAHFANRYAGALPQEGMSKLSREMANLFLFSRSFTLGNLGAYKDIIKGMPSDVRSQVLMDGGIGALERVQGTARRKALSMMVMDVALSYVGLFLAAAATAWLTHQKFQPPWENEEDRQKRFLIGYQPDGTAIYGRLPTGKVGEELQDWATEPREILLRKLSPYGRLIYATAANDKGFGRKLYLPDDPLYKNAGRVGWFAMQGIAPVGQLQGASDAFTGAQDKKTALLQALAPIAGVTISKGAPGGPAMSDFYKAKDVHDFAVQEAMPDIRRQIHMGDVAGARAKMTQLGIAPGLQSYYVRVALAPGGRLKGRALADFNRYATPEQKARLERDRAAAAARDVTP